MFIYVPSLHLLFKKSAAEMWHAGVCCLSGGGQSWFQVQVRKRWVTSVISMAGMCLGEREAQQIQCCSSNNNNRGAGCLKITPLSLLVSHTCPHLPLLRSTLSPGFFSLLLPIYFYPPPVASPPLLLRVLIIYFHVQLLLVPSVNTICFHQSHCTTIRTDELLVLCATAPLSVF